MVNKVFGFFSVRLHHLLQQILLVVFKIFTHINLYKINVFCCCWNRHSSPSSSSSSSSYHFSQVVNKLENTSFGYWDNDLMIAVAPSELEDQVLDADASGNKLRVDALLLGAIKNLKLNKAKPDAILYMNLIYLAKSKPELFLSSRIVEVSLLQAKKALLFKPWCQNA